MDKASLEKSKNNARSIEHEIEMLELNHWNILERKYKDFWEHASRISGMFKSLKPLLREDRERLWERFNSICEETKRNQQSKYENRKYESERHRDYIIAEALRARPGGISTPDEDTLKALGQSLKSAGLMLSKFKHEMIGEHKQECYSIIQEIRQEHESYWQWLRDNRLTRRENFLQKVNANLEKNYERHRKASDKLNQLRNHVEELQDKINSAWNDDYRDRAYGWLSETEDKIRDIESYLERIEEWIREDEEKLR